MESGAVDLADGVVQNVLVMRHGDRMDVADPLWLAQAARPWDPPLAAEGRIRAFTVGRRLRTVGFPIHRVLVSPFLRCLQTAHEVVSALSAIVDAEDHLIALDCSSDGLVIDPSKIKVSIEYGLCEALCREAIRTDLIPKDGNWMPDLSELEAKLPNGTIDNSVECVYKQLPRWEETLAGARRRYEAVFKDLADKFPHENLLLVTHGEGVGMSVSSFMKDVEVFEVEYCAYSHLHRWDTDLHRMENWLQLPHTFCSAYGSGTRFSCPKMNTIHPLIHASMMTGIGLELLIKSKKSSSCWKL